MAGKITALLAAMTIFALQTSATFAATTGDAPPVGTLACPPNFLTDLEQRMFSKEGSIRSGPWHIRCFQNGNGIFDRERVYLFCKKGDTATALEGADGRAIRFQFPADVACTWER